jgi:hypothetical protein
MTPQPAKVQPPDNRSAEAVNATATIVRKLASVQRCKWCGDFIVYKKYFPFCCKECLVICYGNNP